MSGYMYDLVTNKAYDITILYRVWEVFDWLIPRFSLLTVSLNKKVFLFKV